MFCAKQWQKNLDFSNKPAFIYLKDATGNFIYIAPTLKVLGVKESEFEERFDQLLDNSSENSEQLKVKQNISVHGTDGSYILKFKFDHYLKKIKFSETVHTLSDDSTYIQGLAEELDVDENEAEKHENNYLDKVYNEIDHLRRELNKEKELSRNFKRQLGYEKEKYIMKRDTRGEFLSTVSHELRTPLNTIMLLAELIEMEDGSKDVLETNIKKIKDSCLSLIQIINDLIDISKLERGKIVIDRKQFFLRDIIETTVDILRSKAENKGLYLNIHHQHLNNEQEYHSDPARIRQILLNLIGNAIKFTEQGGVDIRIYIKPNFDFDEIKFDIIDTGIGIKTSDIKEVFTPFKQLEDSQTRRYGGTGLGLAICKKLTDLLDGHLRYKINDKGGTTFTFGLPIEKVTHKKTSLSNQEHHSSKSKKILLVDDDEDLLDISTRILTMSGYDVTSASNGEDALMYTNSDVFGVILMDCRMPRMDGLQCTKKIRSDNRNKNNLTPIIALTANAEKEGQSECLAIGMTDFITKPISKKKIQEIIQQYI